MVITCAPSLRCSGWRPRRADLMWGLGCPPSFEPRRRQNPTDGRFARKPTTVVAGHSGDTPVGILDATSPSRRASHPPSGHYAFVPPPDRRFVEVLAVPGSSADDRWGSGAEDVPSSVELRWRPGD